MVLLVVSPMAYVLCVYYESVKYTRFVDKLSRYIQQWAVATDSIMGRSYMRPSWSKYTLSSWKAMILSRIWFELWLKGYNLKYVLRPTISIYTLFPFLLYLDNTNLDNPLL
jgi:hypothetical protein